MVWTLSFSIRQPTEARAGMVFLAILVLWIISASLIHNLEDRPIHSRKMGAGGLEFHHWIWSFHPHSLTAFRINDLGESYLQASILIQGLILVCLWWWAMKRFPRNPWRKNP